ncbi:SH3 domain containing ring finger 1, partial [Elysia marginata]
MDEKQINELIECPVCLDRMDQTCKVLRCQHTFCRRCLDEILSTKLELRCPECRALVTESLDALPTNILVMRILEGLKTKGVKPHGHSNGGRTPVAPRVAASSSSRREPLLSHFSRQLSLYINCSDLSFKKGDIINLKRQIDDNWFQGELAGAVGHLPANFVHDETLTVIRRVDENWLEGRKGDKIGIFPIVFVELNDTAKILISTKSNRSILQQPAPLPSTPSTSSATLVTLTTTSSVASVATALTTDTSNSAPGTPQRSTLSPSGAESPSARPPVPELVVSQSSASRDESPVSATPQVNSQQASTAATESSLVTSLPSSECSVVSPSSPGEPLAVCAQGQGNQTATSSITAVSSSSLSEVIAAAADLPGTENDCVPLDKSDSPSQPNKRHSFTHLSCSSSPLSSGAQQNRHSTEITLPSEFGSVQSGSSSISPAPASTATEVMTLDTTETYLKSAPVSPKQRPSASPTSAVLSDSSVDHSNTLTAPVYTALYSYRPQKDDELELTKGDQYTVTEKCQDGWFKGACLRTGQSGVFPGNYVHISRYDQDYKFVYVSYVSASMPDTRRISKIEDTTVTSKAQRSKSPSVPAPLRSHSHPATSSMLSSGNTGRFHHATPFLPSSSPSSHLAGISLSSKPCFPTPPATSQSHHGLHWSSQPMPSLASIAAQPMPSLASLSAQPMPSLASVASMCASASITSPPNVVMAPSHHSALPLEKEKKEKKEKEKKGLHKLFAGKGKKNKHVPPEPADNSSTMAVLCFDNVAHVRSGSYPAENFMSAGDTSSLLGTSHTRKATSFDAVNIAVPPVPAKPRPKPTYRE